VIYFHHHLLLLLRNMRYNIPKIKLTCIYLFHHLIYTRKFDPVGSFSFNAITLAFSVDIFKLWPFGILLNNTQSVPHRKHYLSATKPNLLMLFRETVAVCCENHTEHTDTLCGQNFTVFKKVACIGTTRILRVILRYKIFLLLFIGVH
jgi:hypothetical protein